MNHPLANPILAIHYILKNKTDYALRSKNALKAF